MRIGKRLRRAIKDAGYGIREFQRAMESRQMELRSEGNERLRGVTYPSINAYLNDDRAPSPTFVEVAADELRVTTQWLAMGKGVRRVIDEHTRKLADEREDRLARGLKTGFPAYGKLWSAARAVMQQTVLDLRAQRVQQGETVEPEAEKDLARTVGRAVNAPLRILGINANTLGRSQRDTYVIGVCLGIAPLAAKRGSRIAPKVS